MLNGRRRPRYRLAAIQLRLRSLLCVERRGRVSGVSRSRGGLNGRELRVRNSTLGGGVFHVEIDITVEIILVEEDGCRRGAGGGAHVTHRTNRAIGDRIARAEHAQVGVIKILL